MSNIPLRNSMGEAGYRQAKSEFTVEAMTQGMLSVYHVDEIPRPYFNPSQSAAIIVAGLSCILFSGQRCRANLARVAVPYGNYSGGASL